MKYIRGEMVGYEYPGEGAANSLAAGPNQTKLKAVKDLLEQNF